jgi:hypothetical protein
MPRITARVARWRLPGAVTLAASILAVVATGAESQDVLVTQAPLPTAVVEPPMYIVDPPRCP